MTPLLRPAADAARSTATAAVAPGPAARRPDAEAVRRRFRASLHGGRVHPLFVSLWLHGAAPGAPLGAAAAGAAD